MSAERHLRAIYLSGHYYVLVQKVTKETVKSIVWKALQWPAGRRFDPEIALIRRPSPGEYLDPLRTEWDSPDLTDLPFEEPSGGRWVAIKVPRPRYEQEIVREAQRLRKLKDLSSRQPGRARVVPVIAGLSQTEGVPILVMEWAPGVQGTDLLPFEDEFRGLTIALKLADLIRTVLLYGIILTDTIKADGIFYDKETDSLTLIDWNTVGGRPEHFRHQTVPIFGQTLYRLFAGKLIPFDEGSFDVKGSQIGDDEVAGRWDGLTYGTRALITDLLLGKVSGTRPDQLASELFDRIKSQIDLWGASTSSLLASARTDTADACLNYYDLAQAQGADLTAEDRKRYNQAVQEVLWKHQAGEHDTALAFLNWARRHCPEDEEVRWAWLAHRVAKRERGAWTQIEPVLIALRNRAYDQAQTLLEEPEPLEFKVLAAEATLRSRMNIGDQWLTADRAKENQRIFKGLAALWERRERGESLADLYGREWIEAMQQQVETYLKRAEGIEELRERLSEELQTGLQTGDISAGIRTLNELYREQSESEGLQVWMQVAEAIHNERAETALEPLAAKGDEVSVILMRIATGQLKRRAQELEKQDRLPEAIALLEQVVRYCRDDEEEADSLARVKQRNETYKALLERLRSAQESNNLEEQDLVLSELLRGGFRYVDDDSLIQRWLECRATRVEKRVAGGSYTAAIEMVEDTLRAQGLGLSLSEQERLRQRASRELGDLKERLERLRSAIEEKDLTVVTEVLGYLCDKLSETEPTTLGVWRKAAKAIEAQTAEEALHPLAESDGELPRMLMRIAVEQLKQRAEDLAKRDHYQEVIALLDLVVEYCSDDIEAKERRDRYYERSSQYERSWREFLSAQDARDFGSQAGALWNLLDIGFARAPDETPLVELWLGSQLKWAEQRSNFEDYTAAIRIADDTLQKIDDLGLSLEERESLRKEAEGQFQQIERERKKVAKRSFDQARNWTRRKDLRLNEALTRAMTTLAQAHRYDPDYNEDGVRAFKRGRELLLVPEPHYASAATELGRAQLWAWDELREIIRPYAEIAQVGAILSTLPDLERASPEDLVGVIGECNELDGILDKWDKSVPESWGDTQVVELHRQLDERVRRKRTDAHKKLNRVLNEWLNDVAHADAALDNQATFADLERVLPVSPVDHPDVKLDEWWVPSVTINRELSQQALEAWGRRVRTLYNLALAQAHLLRAEMDLKQGREDLVEGRYAKAHRAAEAAEQGGYAGPWPDNRPAKDALRGAIMRQLRHLWTEAYEQAEESGKVSAGLQFVQDLVQNSARDLARLSEQYLEAPDPDRTKEAFELLLEPRLENSEDFATFLESYDIDSCCRGLCTYAHAAELVKRERYEDAVGLAALAQEIEAEGRGELEQAVRDQVEGYWEKIFERRERKQLLAQVLKEALISREEAQAETGLDAHLAELDRRYHPQAEGTDLRATLESAFEAWDTGDKHTFADVLAEAPLERWDDLRQTMEEVGQEKKKSYDEEVRSFTGANFVKRTLLVLKGHVGQVLKPAYDAAEESTGLEQDWGQVLQTALWGVAASIAALVLSLGLVVSIVTSVVSPDVREAVVSRFVSPTATPTLPMSTPLPPQGKLAIGSGELRQAGTEVWHTVSVENTGEVTATFEVRPESDLPTEVVWREDRSSPPLDRWPRTTLAPQERKTFWLIVPRMPPGAEPGIQLELLVEGQSTPLYVGHIVPLRKQLEVLDWRMDQDDEEYVQGIDSQASGSFSPSVAGLYGVGCYDEDGNRHGSIPRVYVGAGERGTFVCPLQKGAVGEWHVAAFPLRVDEGEEWSPPDKRDAKFPYEHSFKVREPYYDLTVTQPISPLFDPDPDALVVGLRYELRNTGEVSDTFTVEFVPITNTKRLSLTVMLPEKGLTYTYELTETTGTMPLFRDEYRLAPCPDSSAPDCPVVHLKIWAYYPVRPRQEGERWLLEPPLTFNLILRPRAGEGEPVSEPVEVTEVP